MLALALGGCGAEAQRTAGTGWGQNRVHLHEFLSDLYGVFTKRKLTTAAIGRQVVGHVLCCRPADRPRLADGGANGFFIFLHRRPRGGEKLGLKNIGNYNKKEMKLYS